MIMISENPSVFMINENPLVFIYHKNPAIAKVDPDLGAMIISCVLLLPLFLVWGLIVCLLIVLNTFMLAITAMKNILKARSLGRSQNHKTFSSYKERVDSFMSGLRGGISFVCRKFAEFLPFQKPRNFGFDTGVHSSEKYTPSAPLAEKDTPSAPPEGGSILNSKKRRRE